MNVSALLAMVHADPRDLAARAVYADALLEAADPRGELIALQLERARASARPSRREVELVAAHYAAWLGPIASVIDSGQSRFENGFLCSAALRGERRRPMAPDVLDHPEWRTVELLETVAIETEPQLHHEAAELLARLPWLSTLIAGPSVLRPIRERVRGHSLGCLTLTSRTTDLREVFALLDTRTFPDLRTLRLWPGSLAEEAVVQLGVRVGRTVDLELLVGPQQPERVTRLIERLVPKVRSVSVQSLWGQAHAALRDGRIAIELRDAEPLRARAFRAILDQLGAARVVLHLREENRVPREAYGGLAAAGFAIEFV